ncbi:cellulase [Trichinella spiralis]|uniref:cellulase n=1 Tax=Trichinella spiralis TaxID=6334 RepID=UPI0001EFB815|nr:cellulase [Trichinella spiralis]
MVVTAAAGAGAGNGNGNGGSSASVVASSSVSGGGGGGVVVVNGGSAAAAAAVVAGANVSNGGSGSSPAAGPGTGGGGGHGGPGVAVGGGGGTGTASGNSATTTINDCPYERYNAESVIVLGFFGLQLAQRAHIHAQTDASVVAQLVSGRVGGQRHLDASDQLLDVLLTTHWGIFRQFRRDQFRLLDNTGRLRHRHDGPDDQRLADRGHVVAPVRRRLLAIQSQPALFQTQHAGHIGRCTVVRDRVQFQPLLGSGTDQPVLFDRRQRHHRPSEQQSIEG